MEYIYFLLQLINILIGSTSLYTYLEIDEEHDHSENAKQIALVNTIFPFSVFLLTTAFYFMGMISKIRITYLILFTSILSAAISFAIYYLLWKEKEDYDDNSNKDLKELNEIVYLGGAIALVIISALILGSEIIVSEPFIEHTIIREEAPSKTLHADELLNDIPKKKLTIHSEDKNYDLVIHHSDMAKSKTKHKYQFNDKNLMDDFIGKDPTMQKVIIL